MKLVGRLLDQIYGICPQCGGRKDRSVVSKVTGLCSCCGNLRMREEERAMLKALDRGIPGSCPTCGAPVIIGRKPNTRITTFTPDIRRATTSHETPTW